jgi:type IV secretion system protein VirD4
MKGFSRGCKETGDGVVMGAHKESGLILRHRDFRPILGIGPTGCGKTSTVLTPTLCEWKASAIVWDFKGQLASKTGRARELLGNDVIVLDICRPGGTRYNPLMAIRKDEYLVPDAQKTARLLIDDEKEGIWKNASVIYLTGSIIHVLLSAPDSRKTMLGVREHVLKGDDGLMEMRRSAHSTVRNAAEEIFDKSIEEARKAADAPKATKGAKHEQVQERGQQLRKSVYFTCSVRLADFEFEFLADKTSRSDFAPSDLVAGERPVTLYIVARPVDAINYMRVFRFIICQLMDHLTHEVDVMPDERPKNHTVLFAIDEFLNFQIAEVSQWVTYVREYGVLPVFLAQSREAVELMYGPSLTSNTPLIQFAPMSGREASAMEKNLGEAIEQLPTSTISSRGLWERPTITRGQRTERRALMPAAALMEMEPSDLIIFGHGKPIRATGLQSWRLPPWRDLSGAATRPWQPTSHANAWFGHATPRPGLIV